MSSSVYLLDVSSSFSSSVCFSVIDGIVGYTSRMKGCIYSSTSFWSTFSPSVRGIQISIFISLDYGGIG